MIERLMCALFGHKYITQLTFSPTSRKVGCTRCEREWAMNDSVRAFVDWSGEFEELYKFNGQWPQPKRKWQGLTTDELQEISEFHFHGGLSGREFYDDIEAKLKEKNT